MYTDGSGSLTTYYFFGGAYEVRSDGTTLKYYAFAGMTFAMDDGDGLKYFLTDHLGSIAAVTDATGALLSQQRYMPFGQVRTDVGGGISQTDLGYTSQRDMDAQGNQYSLGLMDYRARMYSPYLNQFSQPDTIIPNPANPQSYNRYSYVLNNPLRFIDPSGRTPACGFSYSDPECAGVPHTTPPLEPPLYPGYGEETRYQDSYVAPQSSGSFVNSESGRLFGHPGGPKEKEPDLPMTEYNIIEAQAQAVVLAIDIFADYTYYVHPNFQSPSWYANSFYEPIDELNPGWSVPGIQPTTSDLWYSVKGVQVYNHSYEPIFVSYIRTSQGGNEFDFKNSTQILPFTAPTYTTLDFNKVDSHAYSNFFPIREKNVVFPGNSYFIQIFMVSESQRYGQVVIQIP